MKLRENFSMKTLAFIAAVAAFTTTAIMGWYQLANFDALWSDGYTMSSGYTRKYLVQQDYHMVKVLVELKDRQMAGAELSLSDRRGIERLEAELDAGATNLRWQLLDQDGQIIYGNTQEDSAQADIDYWVDFRRGEGQLRDVDAGWGYYDIDDLSSAVNAGDYDGVRYDQNWRDLISAWVEAVSAAEPQSMPQTVEAVDSDGEWVAVRQDQVLADEDGYTRILRVVDERYDTYIFYPTVRACLEANSFGYVFDPESLEWVPPPETVAEMEGTDASLILWVDKDLRVDDQYRKAADKIEEWHASREEYLAVTVLCGLLGLVLMIYLCCAAGHKAGVEGIYLNRFHRVPGDVLLFLLALGGVGAVSAGVFIVADAYGDAPMFIQLIGVGQSVAIAAALGIAALLTVCVRCKAHTLLRNTWTWKLCAWCWRLLVRALVWLWELFVATGRAVQAVPLIWKAVIGCMAYPIFTMATIRWATGLWLIVTFVVMTYLCRWAYQWKKIRRGTQEIIGGNPDYHIDTRYMLPDLKGHADELNNLGHAISAAVEDRMRSEHFKAELITNVSHDLKTPLTSIINYVDLLKKEDIDNPKAVEYIEVLDRKSQRLKKLTEDLVEASKASTGNLTVDLERLDWCQLIDQALAECGDRLAAQGLTVVRSLPEGPLWVDADGRHLWRVLDNLLTNCAKYALPGTRVYVDLRCSGDRAVLSVKNISRDALDVPAERLMERFVRGDESRNEAGSGLGLSIAQSLAELQHGRFEIAIDGDLFKAIVTLPLAGDDPKIPIELKL